MSQVAEVGMFFAAAAALAVDCWDCDNALRQDNVSLVRSSSTPRSCDCAALNGPQTTSGDGWNFQAADVPG